MAYETTIADYETVIGALPENTVDTPYEVFIIDIENLSRETGQSDSNLSRSITNCSRYINLGWATGNIWNQTDASNLFGTSFLVGIDTSPFVSVTNTEYMFYGCSSLKSIDLSPFTNNQSSSNYNMFEGCTGLESITVSNVISYYVARSFNENIKQKVLVYSTIEGYRNLGLMLDDNGIDDPYDVIITDIENITKGEISYQSTPGNLGGNIKAARRYVNIKWSKRREWSGTDSSFMFFDCYYLKSIDLSPFTNVDNAGGMFSSITAFSSVTYNLNTSASVINEIPESVERTIVYEVSIAKYENAVKTLPENNIDTPYDITITDIENLHYTNLKNRIRNAGRFVNIKWIEGSIFNKNDASNMFNGCSLLVSLETYPFINVTDASLMFVGCTNLQEIDTSSFSNVTNASAMFIDCTNLQEIDASSFTNVTYASYMFTRCTNLQEIDASSFTNVTDASFMFSGCRNLQKIDNPSFTNVTDASQMFYNCTNLQEIDTSSFSNVTNASAMFGGCESLRKIDILSLNLVTNMNYMFIGCNSLEVIRICNTENVNSANKLFDEVTSATIYCIPELESDAVMAQIEAYTGPKKNGMLVKCEEYKDILSSLPENTSETPYNIFISDPENIASLGVEGD